MVVRWLSSRGDDHRRSFAAGGRVRIASPRTIADGLASDAPGALTWSVNHRLVSEVVLVSDDARGNIDSERFVELLRTCRC